MGKSRRTGIFIPVKLLDNPLASCSLRNFNVLLSILPDNEADIFAASLLILWCNFSFLVLSSIVLISFYILSTKFFLKRKG